MQIKVKNLGNILLGVMEVHNDILNIKYGINGTGKSTISKGIELSIKSPENLSFLRPHGSNNEPEVEFDEEFKNVLVFNQEYVDTYLFKNDLLNNSFQILINTSEYQIAKSKIDDMFIDVVTSINNSKINRIINDLNELITNIPVEISTAKATKGKYNIKQSTKFERGRKTSSLELKLKGEALKYKNYLVASNNHEWLKWFQDGKKHTNQNNECPYCLSETDKNFKEIENCILEVANTTALKQNMDLKKTIDKTKDIINSQNVDTIISSVNEEGVLNQDVLKKLYNTIEICKQELVKLRNIQSINVSEIRKKYENNTLISFFEENQLNVDFYTSTAEELQEEINKINYSINKIKLKANELEQLAKEFSDKVSERVKNREKYINDFLEISGIPYKVEIIEKQGSYVTILKPQNCGEEVNDKCLSFGEKNAISLILFSLEAENDYDLVILDDPVSSFDNNKKFAIMYYLFSMQNAIFKDRTVIFFTHDFDILVDLAYKSEFKKIKNKSYFVKNENGNFKETIINSNNINYTLRKWKKIAKNKEIHVLLRVVNLRKYLQYASPENSTAINILSSLEHNQERPMKRENGKNVVIEDANALNRGIDVIKLSLENFDYKMYFNNLQNKEELKQLYQNSKTSIEKLQVLRMLVNLNSCEIKSQVFWNYLTEYYHVENNEMTSLDEHIFDVIPEYIIKLADGIIDEMFD